MIRKNINKLTGAISLMLLGTVTGCSNEECYENKNSLPLAGFYSSAEKPQSVTISNISIYGIGAPGDSILHDSASSLSQTYLPFQINSETTSYVIAYLQGELGKNEVKDTITFNYEIVPWFVSSACGAVYNYKIKEIETTHHVIDSVTCPEGEITNLNKENLKIYFRVQGI